MNFRMLVTRSRDAMQPDEVIASARPAHARAGVTIAVRVATQLAASIRPPAQKLTLTLSSPPKLLTCGLMNTAAIAARSVTCDVSR